MRRQLQAEAVAYTTCVTENRYLPIDFETLQEYLTLLELCARSFGKLNERVCFYLAAAVSDFYIPDEQVSRQTNCTALCTCD